MSDDENMNEFDTNPAAASSSASSSSRKRKSGIDSSVIPQRARRQVAAVNYNEREAEGDEDEVNNEEEEDDADDSEEKEEYRRSKKRKSTAASPSTPSRGKDRRTADEEQEEEDVEHILAEEKQVEQYFSHDAAHVGNGGTGDSDDDEPAEMTLEEARNFQRTGGRKNDDEAPRPYIPLNPNAVAPAGILKRLRLRNFMNHRRLDLHFNPCVNFIHGKNGAGKSSILHAIQVVFGGNAADTKRGSSVKQLITEGFDEAEVTVWIKNEESAHASTAFKHDQYGDEIQLTRKLKLTGSSTYCMSGVNSYAKNRTTATKDIKEMYSHFNILVSNPCVIMTQEVSKKFLQSGDPAERYAFFTQATQIEGLRSELATAIQDVEQMVTTYDRESSTLPDLEQQIAELVKQEKLAEETESIHRDLLLLSSKLLWREVKDLDIQYDTLHFKYLGVKKNFDKAKSKRAALINEMESEAEFNAKVAQHEQSMTSSAAKSASFTRDIEAKNQSIIRIKQEQKGVLARIKNWENEIKEFAKKKTGLEKKIEQIAEKNARDTSSMDKEREDEMGRLKEKKQSLQAEIEKLRAESRESSSKSSECRMEESRAQEQCNFIQKRVNDAESQVKHLENESGASSSSAASSVIGAHGYRYNHDFGFHSASIWTAIKRAKWKVEPIGPIGEYVHFKEDSKKWATAVSGCMQRRNMTHWIVDCFEDQHTLRNIFKQLNLDTHPPTMIVRKPEKRFHVVRPDVSFAMVQDCIQFDLDWAFNAAIYLTKFDRFALFERSEDAVSELKAMWQNQDKSVAGALLIEGNKVQVKGAAGSIVIEKTGARPMFRISNVERINMLKGEIAKFKAELQTSMNEARTKRADTRAHEAVEQKAKQRIYSLEREKGNLDEQLSGLQFESEKARREMIQEDDTPYRDEILRLTNDTNEIEQRMAASKRTDEKEFLDRIAVVQQEISEIEDKLKLSDEEQDVERKWLEEAGLEWAKKQHSLKKYEEREKEFAVAIADLEQQLMPLSEQRLLAFTKAQAQHAEELKPEETWAQLNAMHTAKYQIWQEKQRREKIDINHVRASLKATQLKKAETEARMSGVQRSMGQLKDMGRRRMLNMKKCRTALGNSASAVFADILLQSGAGGKLDFNHENQTMSMTVNPNTNDAERHDAKSTIVLSGGERSVTTIAFTMAVGELAQSPFRAIDEFDVFMDSINRRRSIDLLLTIARSRKDRQFFFLSPQDVNGIKVDSYLQVLKLKDPIRHQTTLGFTQDDEPNQE